MSVATNTTAAEALITAPASATIDGQSASAKTADDVASAIVFAEGRAELQGQTNARGGKRSGWGCLRMAKAILPGGG
jgi:hypothetical protein